MAATTPSKITMPSTTCPTGGTATSKSSRQQQLLFLEEALEKLNYDMDSSGNSTTVHSSDDDSKESGNDSDYDSDSDSSWSIEDDDSSNEEEEEGRYQNHLLTSFLSKSNGKNTKNAALSSLQTMIQQAEQQAMATMSTLRAQQEKQGATHDSHSAADHPGGLKKTSSVANFQCMGHIKESIPSALGGEEGLRRNVSITNFQAMGHTPSSEYGGVTQTSVTTPPTIESPEDHLISLLDPANPGWLAHDSSSLEGFFLEPKPDHMAAWDTDLVQAVRHHDLEALKARTSLQASNAFGESIVHLCVRRGSPELLHYLVEDAHVSIRVCCENGRTALHDACWSLSRRPYNNNKSNSATLSSSSSDDEKDDDPFAMMQMLLEECPLLLFIQDKRGHSPLSYVPKTMWADCNSFLDRMKDEGRLP